MLLKIAWRNIWRNKRRTLITISSVLFAVVFAVIIKGLKEGMYDRMIGNIVGDYFGYLQLHTDGYLEDQILDNSFLLSKKLTDSLENLPYVVEAIPRLQNFALVSSDTITKGAMILGVSPALEGRVTELEDRIIEGQMIREDKAEVVLGYQLAEYLKLNPRDTLVVFGQGFRGSLMAGKFPVRGLVKFPYPELNNSFVMMPIQTSQELMSTGDRATALILNLKNTRMLDKHTKELNNYLGNRYEIMNWKEMLPEIQKLIEGDRAEGIILMGILYILVSFGIFGTVLMMLIERMYEFGIMLAIGMKKRKLAFLVWFEMVIMTMLGGIAGMIVSYPLLIYFNLYPIHLGKDIAKAFEEFGFEPVMQTTTDPLILFQQGLIVVLLASVISLYPIIKIMRLNVIKAMRQ